MTQKDFFLSEHREGGMLKRMKRWPKSSFEDTVIANLIWG